MNFRSSLDPIIQLDVYNEYEKHGICTAVPYTYVLCLQCMLGPRAFPRVAVFIKHVVLNRCAFILRFYRFDFKNDKRASDGSYSSTGNAGDHSLHRETRDNHKSIKVYSCCTTDKELSD